MRNKLADWTVGEQVVFISEHTNKPEVMVVTSIGKKYLGIGRDKHNYQYKFIYNGDELTCTGEHRHTVYSQEEYALMLAYTENLRDAIKGITSGMHGQHRWTKKNIQLLGNIINIIEEIKSE